MIVLSISTENANHTRNSTLPNNSFVNVIGRSFPLFKKLILTTVSEEHLNKLDKPIGGFENFKNSLHSRF